MTKEEIRLSLAYTIAGIKPSDDDAEKIIDAGNYLDRADAMLRLFDTLIDQRRREAIDGVARYYHEAKASKLEADAAATEYLPAEASRLRAMAECHRTYAREIREQAWWTDRSKVLERKERVHRSPNVEADSSLETVFRHSKSVSEDDDAVPPFQ